MRRLLALDPGQTTGWSLWEYDESTPLRHVSHGMQAGGLEGLIAWWRRCEVRCEWDEVVCESFVLDGRTLYPDVTPLRIEGALTALWPEGVTFQRNNMKAHATDAKLKELGLWWPGAGHDRDSARHALAYMKTAVRHIPTIKWAYPPARA